MALLNRLKLRFDDLVNRLQSLISRVRGCCETFPDKRHGANLTYPIADIGIAAFALPTMFEAASKQRRDRVFPRHVGGDPGRARSQSCRAARTRIHRPPGRGGEAGL